MGQFREFSGVEVLAGLFIYWPILIKVTYQIFIYSICYTLPFYPAGIHTGLHHPLLFHFMLITTLWGKIGWERDSAVRSLCKVPWYKQGFESRSFWSKSSMLTPMSHWLYVDMMGKNMSNLLLCPAQIIIWHRTILLRMKLRLSELIIPFVSWKCCIEPLLGFIFLW